MSPELFESRTENNKGHRKPELVSIALSSIVFNEDIYPRQAHDPVKVQEYADCMESIEARGNFISVRKDHALLDGKHRWLAYRKLHEDKDDPEIRAYRYPVDGWLASFDLANELNGSHGWQTSMADKEQNAKRYYQYGITSYDDIATRLRVGKARVSAWLSRTVKEEREKRNEKIFRLWLACHTQDDIAKTIGCSRDVVQTEIEGFVEKVLQNQNHKTSASHATDFDPPIYNVWKQQTKTPGSSHFGNSEIRWLDNLLYLYTQPFDVVVDPFAGGGSTIDLCRQRFRRYWVSDRKPIIERETEIRQWDITKGLPPLPRWQDVKLVYLDPPYWKQAESQYSTDPTDLANMTLEEFTKILASSIARFAKKLSPGAVIALLMQPTQWNAPEHRYTDHIADLLRCVKLPLAMRVSCPYESQQVNAQMVEHAKANRMLLVLTREMVIWQVAS